MAIPQIPANAQVGQVFDEWRIVEVYNGALADYRLEMVEEEPVEEEPVEEPGPLEPGIEVDAGLEMNSACKMLIQGQIPAQFSLVTLPQLQAVAAVNAVTGGVPLAAGGHVWVGSDACGLSIRTENGRVRMWVVSDAYAGQQYAFVLYYDKQAAAGA